MKANLLTVFLLVFFLAVNGQNDSSIPGVWKIISIKVEGAYYNFKNDSISLSDEIKSKHNDQRAQQKLFDNIKAMFSTIEFHFEKSGGFKQMAMGEIKINGSYRIIPSQNLIEIVTKNSLEEDASDKVKYWFINGLLTLSMNWHDELFEFVLEKAD